MSLPARMAAMVLPRPGAPLQLTDLPLPVPGPGQILLRVLACGVCRTDLHIVDGELEPRPPPRVPGHEVVGRIEALGAGVPEFTCGERVGIGWLGWTCGHCRYCNHARENLCDEARFTGYDLAGGYAEFMLADARYAFRLPTCYADPEAAPLLCAGLIGYRAYAMACALTGGQNLGLYGFGAAAHLLAQIAAAEGHAVYAFTRPGDVEGQAFAHSRGAVWAGGSDAPPPVPLDAAVLFAPDGRLVPTALRAVRKGGAVVCAGIHMSEIPAFPYAWLWGERTLRSVANLTRKDGQEFFRLAQRHRLRVSAKVYALRDANVALAELRAGRIAGAAVLVP